MQHDSIQLNVARQFNVSRAVERSHHFQSADGGFIVCHSHLESQYPLLKKNPCIDFTFDCCTENWTACEPYAVLSPAFTEVICREKTASQEVQSIGYVLVTLLTRVNHVQILVNSHCSVHRITS